MKTALGASLRVGTFAFVYGISPAVLGIAALLDGAPVSLADSGALAIYSVAGLFGVVHGVTSEAVVGLLDTQGTTPRNAIAKFSAVIAGGLPGSIGYYFVFADTSHGLEHPLLQLGSLWLLATALGLVASLVSTRFRTTGGAA